MEWVREIARRIKLEFVVEVSDCWGALAASRLVCLVQSQASTSAHKSASCWPCQQLGSCGIAAPCTLPPVAHANGPAAPPVPTPPRAQLPLLKARWKQVLFGALFQYVHGIFTQLAHRMHQPQAQPLGDIGFKYLPVRACMPCRGCFGRERRC